LSVYNQRKIRLCPRLARQSTIQNNDSSSHCNTKISTFVVSLILKPPSKAAKWKCEFLSLSEDYNPLDS